MSTKLKNNKDWLYSENQDFAQGTVENPVNESEILYNLNRHYGVTDLEPPLRIIAGIITYLLCILMIYSAAIWIRIELQEGMFSNSIFVSLGALIGIGGAIALFGKVSLNLLVHRTKKVQESWCKLIDEGCLLDVDSLDEQVKIPNLQLTYTFHNSDGKRIKGKYLMKGQALARPSKHPKVLYVNDKLHTLL